MYFAIIMEMQLFENVGMHSRHACIHVYVCVCVCVCVCVRVCVCSVLHAYVHVHVHVCLCLVGVSGWLVVSCGSFRLLPAGGALRRWITVTLSSLQVKLYL